MTDSTDTPEQGTLFESVETDLRTVPLDEIEPTEGVSDKMRAAIDVLGNVSTPIVRLTGEPWEESDHAYEIVDGRRRIAALRSQGAEEIEVYAIPPDMEAEAEALTASMNIVREPNPLEEARSIAHLIEEHGYTPESLSKINIPQQTTKKRLRLWRAPEPVKEGVAEGEVAVGVAEKVANLPPELQEECAAFYEEEGTLRHKDVTEIRQADRSESAESMDDDLFDTPDVSREAAEGGAEATPEEGGGEEGPEDERPETGVEVPQDEGAFRDYIVIAGAVRGLVVADEHESVEEAVEAAVALGKKNGLAPEEVLALLETAPAHFLGSGSYTSLRSEIL